MKNILFIQGGGDGAHLEDKPLADYLKKVLDSEYEVTYPKFLGLETVVYQTWRDEAREELKRLGNNDIIVAHSLGGAAVLKYLSEEPDDILFAGLFLIATPYKVKDGEWATDDFAMEVNFASNLPKMKSIFMYHSRDDEWVPFSHLDQWADKIPQSVTRQFDDRGHSFSDREFIELIDDIRTPS